MMAPHVQSFKIWFGCSGLSQSGEPGYKYVNGVVQTRQGYVRVYSQDGHTRLSIIRDGRQIDATWDRGFRPRHLATLARRFARGEFDA